MQKLIDTMDAAFSSLAELEAEALMDAAGAQEESRGLVRQLHES